MNKNKKSALKSKPVEDEVSETQAAEKVEKKNKAGKKKNKEAVEKKNKKEKIVHAVEKETSAATTTTNLSEAELKKIEKKKAKKLAQKLKKAERKASGKTNEATTQGTKQEGQQDKLSKKAKKRKLESTETSETAEEGQNKKKKNKKNKLKKANEEQTEGEQKKSEPTPKAGGTKDASEVSERVLLKKEKKLKKRQELKAQKLAEKKPRDPAQEDATVFVGNLPVTTKRVQLIKLFKKYGPVNSIRMRTAAGQILYKHKMRKASGALNAYVVLQSKTAAEKALELNGTEFKGMHLRVTKSSLKHSASAQESKEEAKRTIFVGNLKYTATEESLRETFSSCGEIEYVRCIREGTKGCKGVAYVRFKTADAVGLALELNQTLLDDRPINVERYSVKKLGAKEQRDAQAAKEKQNQNPKNKGDKSKKFNKSKDSKPQQNKSQGDEGKKSKKSEFRGVKVEALKKKNKQKKKKPSQAMDIAKKIAPRTKSEE
ncbi:RNA-binding protein 34 [Musca domestica]|uniref:RNA-binding protein 34 n=1 Tax=Musca domestica TaxID=7370 RepID=A0A1I8N692_MUSDO|nr:RNA-binding protein 34 [Musca domestica]